jgi:hypothetical protein
MNAWLALLRLDVDHGYYADGRCRGLRFEPVEDTAAALRRADVHIRSDGSSLHLHGPADALDAFDKQDHAAGLAWRIFATDAAFACGTEDPAKRPRQLLWVQGPEAGGGTTLQAVPMPLDDPRVAPLLTPRDRQLPPFALLWLPVAGLRAAAAPWRLRWPLTPRATFWKYCLLGDWPEPALAVVDLAGQTDFSAPTPDRLDDGTPMLAIRSRGRLPLAQRSIQRLQLRSRPEQDGRADKVLIRRLPTPAAQFLARDVIDGQPAVISEIHVHR